MVRHPSGFVRLLADALRGLVPERLQHPVDLDAGFSLGLIRPGDAGSEL